MLLLGWSIFVNPGGSWPGMLSIAALATLLVISTTVLLLARTRAPAASLAQVIQEGGEGTRAQAVRGLERQGNSMKVRPLHDRLVVRRVEEKETAKGGIIIPDTAKEKPQEGEVLGRRQRQGPGERDEGRPRRQGRRQDPVREVLGHDIRIDGEDVLILREDEVLAVLA
jgi:chaperonin GroES